MRRLTAGLLLMGLTLTAFAAGPNQVRKRAEASMVVTGTIDIMPDGTVHGYAIDHPEKLPPIVVSMIQGSVPGWKFKVDGNPQVIQRAQMDLRIVAKRLDDTHDTLSIASTNFDEPPSLGQSPTYKSRLAPRYPLAAIQARVDGTVYLLLRIGRDGTVMDAGVEQVNLHEYASDNDMKHYRATLADSALSAAKRWTFNVPTSGPGSEKPYWYVRVPVVYTYSNFRTPEAADDYGKWDVYIPGPREAISWLQQDAPQSSQGSDAIPAGSISQVAENLHLLTQPSG
jgi:hypothetical protein